jgi:hypothetical protein
MLGAASKGRYGGFERALRNDDLAHDDVISQIVLAGIHGVHGRITDGLRLLERVERSSRYVPRIRSLRHI